MYFIFLIQVLLKPETSKSKSISHIRVDKDKELVTSQGVRNKDIKVVELFLLKLLE